MSDCPSGRGHIAISGLAIAVGGLLQEPEAPLMLVRHPRTHRDRVISREYRLSGR
jgi:hypothetical protein